MARCSISRLQVFGLALLMFATLSLAGAAPAVAGQNGFGDVMTATSYFPVRNLSAFGPDDDTGSSALVAVNGPGAAAPDSAAAMSAIAPAAGDAAAHAEPYGPFQPGKAPSETVH